MMMRRHTTARGSRGFTLVELVVVMMIISILAGAIAVAVTNRVKMARRARAISDISSLQTALDLYEADNGKPPTTEQGLDALRVKPSSVPVPRNWNGPYLQKRVPLDPWGNEYLYQYPGQYHENEYDLTCYGADGQPGGEDWDEDITNHD